MKTKKKVRVNITLTEDIFLESKKYINNLSSYLNRCLSQAIASYKKKEKGGIKNEDKKYEDEELDPTLKWW